MPLEWVVRSLASPHGSPPLHTENQDNYLVIDGSGRVFRLADQKPLSFNHPCWRQGAWRLAVVDGMGGHAQGRHMAELLVHALTLLPPTRGPDLPAAIEGIHQRLQQSFGRWHHPPPGATLTLLEHPAEDQASATLFHVGDSRLLQCDPTGLKLLSIDHTPAALTVMQHTNNLHHWQKQVFSRKGRALCQAIGVGNALRGRFEAVLRPLEAAGLPWAYAHLADRRPVVLQANSHYLLATDGLWHHLQPDTVLEQLPALIASAPAEHRNLASLADAILKTHCLATQPRASSDNATFILFRYQESSP